MKLITKTVPLFLLLIALGCSPGKKEDSENQLSEKPNVVIVFTDDQGYQDLGNFGSPNIKTPNIDRMATEGARYTSFYVAQPVCSASRAGLLTGCYPNRVGIHGAFMPDANRGLNPNEVTIAEMLKQEGYSTAHFGKWHLGDAEEFMPTKQGFDEFYGIPYSNDMWPEHPWQGSIFDFPPLPLYENEAVIDTLEDQSLLTTWITERSVQFIEDNKENPFFLYVAHPQPHVPLFVSDKFKGKSERGLYGDVIMEIDWSVGQILDALKQNGLDENTLVIFTSDNGPWLSYGEHSGSALPLREGKGTAWEGGVREPCVIRYPGIIPAGITIDVPFMTIDILPSLAHITGASLPENYIDGKNAWNVIVGESSESPQEAYYFYYHQNELHAVLSEGWKLYLPHRYRTLGGKEGGKEGLPTDYEYVTVEKPELYNINDDISESMNVASENPEIVSRLMDLADGIRNDLGDKLLDVEGTGQRQAGEIIVYQ